MNNILVFTSTRAEYGLLRWIIKSLSTKFRVITVVGGTHLSPEDGFTLQEITRDKVKNIIELPFLLTSKSPGAFTTAVGNGIIQMSQVFSHHKPRFTLILGDRFELMIPALTSLLNNVPLVHLHGGEITEGVIDEQVRHAITKMAHVHMPSTEFYAENISRMGEEDWRIHITGAPGLENAAREKLWSPDEIKKRLGLDPRRPTFLCTYHPVTLELEDTRRQISNLLRALCRFPDDQIVFTRPNAEKGSDVIIAKLHKAVRLHPETWFFFESLGIRMYQSLLPHVRALVGNSSSGLIEGSFFQVSTVDIGNRQKGRFMPPNVIHTGYATDEIAAAIQNAADPRFRKMRKAAKSPFGDGRTSLHVLRALVQTSHLPTEKLLKKKLDFKVNKNAWHRYF